MKIPVFPDVQNLVPVNHYGGEPVNIRINLMGSDRMRMDIAPSTFPNSLIMPLVAILH